MIQCTTATFWHRRPIRDDLNGFSIIKIIEGGPAAENKGLKVKDRIIAVNGEPVVGLDIVDAVELIRGEKIHLSLLTVIREPHENESNKNEEKLDITIKRGEVVLKKPAMNHPMSTFWRWCHRLISRLYSFYQDPDSSSSDRSGNEIEKLKKEHHVKGVILDLRYNSGGLLVSSR